MISSKKLVSHSFHIRQTECPKSILVSHSIQSQIKIRQLPQYIKRQWSMCVSLDIHMSKPPHQAKNHIKSVETLWSLPWFQLWTSTSFKSKAPFSTANSIHHQVIKPTFRTQTHPQLPPAHLILLNLFSLPLNLFFIYTSVLILSSTLSDSVSSPLLSTLPHYLFVKLWPLPFNLVELNAAHWINSSIQFGEKNLNPDSMTNHFSCVVLSFPF
jgi:hypothetical protein